MMATIKIRELQEVMHKLPEIELFEAVQEERRGPAAMFLCALGFEPRCLAIPEALAETGLRCERAVYFEYRSNTVANDGNRTALISRLSSVSSSVESMDADAPDFTQRLSSVLQDLSRREPRPRILIDISVFGNRLAFKLYGVLLDADVDVTILYAEAAVYHPTHGEYLRAPRSWGAEQGLGLERGVSSIGISPEHPGQFLDPLPDFVLVFPAFDPDRSKAALEWIDPSLVSAPDNKIAWFVGRPHLDADNWRQSAVRNHHNLTPAAYQVEVSTFDYKDALQALHTVCENRADRSNLTLVPLGSKLQALGAALCCFIHPEVRVLFVVPREYNAAAYSEGTKAIWKIAIGGVGKLRSMLIDVGTLEVLE